ncbi:MAG: acyl carrier protein [Firmicutes bacterium]|nr:acyl carrier protein [Bacillota bacterium]
MELEKIKEILAEQLGVSEDDINADSSLTDDLGADSLDLVELVMAMEQEFDIEISDEDAEKIKTVGDAVNFVKEKAL